MPEMVPGHLPRAPQPAQTGQPTLSLENADTRVAFATAIARPRTHTLLLDRHNKAAGEWSIVAAAHRDKVHAVEVADHLMVLDIDEDDDLAAAHTAMERVTDAAAAANVPHVVVTSGRGWHIYLVVGELVAVRARRLRAALAGFGDCVRSGRNQRIRPIGARHRHAAATGRRACPTGTTLASALAVLTGPPADPGQIDDLADALHRDAPAAVRPAARLRVRRRDLSDTARLITSAPMPARDDLGDLAQFTIEGTRSALVHVVACSAAASGWTADEWLELSRSTWLGAYARDKQPGNPRAWLLADYARAINFVAAAPPRNRDLAAEHQQLRVALAAHPGVHARWWREGGHALLDGLLALTAANPDRPVHLSVRAAAELINASKSAAHRHLVHLDATGLIERAPGEGAAAGALVRVRTAAVRALVSSGPPRGAWQECPTSGTTHHERVLDLLDTRAADVWTWHGLGHTAWRTLVSHAVHHGHPPTGALGISSGWHATLERRLRRHHLLSTDDDLLDEALIDAAANLDVAGRLRLLQVTHADDRETFAPVAARIDAKAQALDHPDAAEQLQLQAA